jgi:hypothetical protein
MLDRYGLKVTSINNSKCYLRVNPFNSSEDETRTNVYANLPILRSFHDSFQKPHRDLGGGATFHITNMAIFITKVYFTKHVSVSQNSTLNDAEDAMNMSKFRSLAIHQK